VRFLHTADWHVGKPLRGRARFDELAATLEEVARIALEAKVDAVLVAGDVFDSPAPPPEAERLVYDFLARLVPERVGCLLIAGNHDHPKKLAALERLLEGFGIHVRAEVRPPDKGGVVTLASRDGREQARVAVLPFVAERRVVDACQLLEAEYAWYEEYARRVEQILAFLAQGLTADTVNLVLAHVLISGARVGTGERPLHLGEIYGVNAQQLPDKLQYIGLGHLHRPQEILAPSKTCYAGSLLELDFGEREQDKRVVLVEAHAGRAATLESVPIRTGRRLRDVKGSLAELEALAPELGDAWLRVTVTAAGPEPGLAERVKQRLPRALEVTVDYPRCEAPPASAGRGTLAPADLFADFYRSRNAVEPPADLLALFREVYEEDGR